MARDRGSFSNATLLTVGGVSAWMVIEVRAVQPENIEQIDVQLIAFNTVEKSC